MLLRGIGLATLGTVADVMPLLDENRILVKHGLECLRQRGGTGIERLMELSKLHEKSAIDSEDVAFRLAPRLNAAGRLGQAGLAIEMLTTHDDARATQLADWIHGFNEQRDSLERSILLAATKQALHDFDPVADAALVLAGRGWHAGVVGIVAGRLAERYHRPVVVIAQDEHQGRPATGSLRSVSGFDILAPLLACREHLLKCGGHAAAAGLRIEDDRIDDFRRAFLAAVAERMPEELRQAQVTIDGEATIASLTLDTCGQIEKLAPFGQANRRPVLCASAVRLAEPARAMGGGGRHLSMTLLQHGTKIRAVAWGGAEWLPHLPAPGQPFHVAFKPKINEFRGRRTAEMEVVDWRPDCVDITLPRPPPAPSPPDGPKPAEAPVAPFDLRAPFSKGHFHVAHHATRLASSNRRHPRAPSLDMRRGPRRRLATVARTAARRPMAREWDPVVAAGRWPAGEVAGRGGRRLLRPGGGRGPCLSHGLPHPLRRRIQQSLAAHGARRPRAGALLRRGRWPPVVEA
jgi:single-stranded-DNA-specific exonuclease